MLSSALLSAARSASAVTCVMGPMDAGWASLERHEAGGAGRRGTAGGPSYGAALALRTRLGMDGDALRVVSQGTYDGFGDMVNTGGPNAGGIQRQQQARGVPMLPVGISNN